MSVEVQLNRGWTAPSVITALILVASLRAFALVNIAELALLCIVIWSPLLRAEFQSVCSSPLGTAILLLLGWIAVSSLWSESMIIARIDDILSWRKLLVALAISAVLREIKAVRQVFKPMFCLSALVLFFSYGLHADLIPSAVFGYNMNWRHPAHLIENYVTQSLVFTFCCYYIVIFSLDAKNRYCYQNALLVILLILFVSNIIFLSESRSGFVASFILALTLTACVSITAGYKINVCRAGVMGIVLVIIAIGLGLMSERVTSSIDQFFAYLSAESIEESSVSMRLWLWEIGLLVVFEHPLIGTGAGNYANVFFNIVQSHVHPGDWRYLKSDDPHNMYLLIWGEYGLIGLILFLNIILQILKRFSLIKPSFALPLLGLLATYLINSWFSGHFASFVEGRLFWYFMIPLALHVPQMSRDYTQEDSSKT